MSTPKKTKPWVPKLFPKQVKIFNCYKRFVLVSGPRKSSKTIGVVHRVTRHLWETKGAVVGVFSKILRTAKDTGVWQDFLTIVLPEWMGRTIDEDGNETYVPVLYNQYGQPFEFLTKDSQGIPGPKSDSTTRSMYFKVRNRHGGSSKLLLFSLDNENEATARLKQTRFSMIYVPELSEFKTDVMYKIGSQQLRIGNHEDQQWIADTNPSDDGEDSWIWDLFYKQRTQLDHPEPLVRDSLELIEVFLQDNPTLTEYDRSSLRQAYSGDQGEFERNINGLWVKGHGKIGKVFADIFSEVHVIPDFVDININYSDFFGGFDIGDVNSAAVMIERRMVVNNLGKEQSVWIIFDEVAAIDTPISTEDFTIQYMDQLKETEDFYGKKINFTKFWSDDDAVNKYRGTASTYDYLVVRAASDGAIELNGVSKPSGSIGARVRLIRQLLQDNRFFVGSNCVHTIEMFKGMMKGGGDPIAKGSRHKHIFDALSYPIFMESLEDMDLSGQPKSRSNSTGFISV